MDAETVVSGPNGRLPEMSPRGARLDGTLAGFAEAVPLPIVAVDRDGNVILWNSAMARAFGWTFGEVAGKPYPLWNDVKLAAYRSEIRSSIPPKRLDGVEQVRYARDGTPVTVRIWGSLLKDRHDRPEGMLAILEKVTGENRAPRAIEASEELFAKAFLAGPAPMAITTFDEGRILEVNRALEELLGYQRAELVGRTTTEVGVLVTPREAGLEEIRRKSVLRDKRLAWRRKDGTLVLTRTFFQLIEYLGEQCLLTVFVDETEMREAQVQLEASEERYRTLMLQASDAILVTDEKDRFIDVNEAACELMGFTRAELLSRAIPDVVPAQLHAQQARSMARVHAGDTIRLEAPFVRKDGSRVWVELVASRLPDGSVQAIARDITGRRAAERRAQRLQQLYVATAEIDRAIARAADAGALFAEACRIAVEVGGFRLAWIGLLDESSPNGAIRVAASAGEALGLLEGVDAAADDDRRLAVQLRLGDEDAVPGRAVMARPHISQAMVRAGLQSGVVVPLRVSDRVIGGMAAYDATPDAFAETETALLARIADDVSYRYESIERERERQAAELQLQRLARAVDEASEGVFIVSTDGDIEYVNAAFAEIVRRPLEELIGSPSSRYLLEQSGGEQILAEIGETIDRGGVWTGELDAVRGDGSRYRAALTVSRLHKDGDGGTELMGVMRDVTRERELEDQLRQAQKMEALGRLAGGIAHDFNNLLTAIGGYASLARADLAGSGFAGSGIGEDLDAIQAAAGRAAELTRQLLAFARRSRIEPAVLDLDQLVIGLAPMLRRLIGDDVELRVTPGPLSGRVRADEAQMQQVIMNLAVNARDAMPDGGVLTIATADVALDSSFTAAHPRLAEGAYVELSVSDTGAGIDPEILDRIFEPFFTTKERGRGTGLGLSMVFGTVESSGGTIVVESRPGAGTTFRVYLPVTDERPVRASDQEAPEIVPGFGRGRTVLVVEDDEAVRSFAAQVLAQAGFTVLRASDGADGVKLASAHSGTIDVVVSDLVMPRLNGVDAVEHIRRKRPNVPALFVSGYADRRISWTHVTRAGFLQKPYDRESLLMTVASLLEAEEPARS